MKKNICLLPLLIAVFLSACSGVQRIDTREIVDLSGKWNDTDSRFVSEAMIEDSLSRPWINKFKSSHGGKSPVVIVGTVKNRSHEHINVQTFTKDLERALINSGEVEFVASKEERNEIREERIDQASHSSEQTAKSEGEEAGADYMLKGSVNSILDKIEGKAVVFYQVNLEMIHMQSHKKVWIGEKKIKKLVKRKRLGF